MGTEFFRRYADLISEAEKSDKKDDKKDDKKADDKEDKRPAWLKDKDKKKPC